MSILSNKSIENPWLMQLRRGWESTLPTSEALRSARFDAVVGSPRLKAIGSWTEAEGYPGETPADLARRAFEYCQGSPLLWSPSRPATFEI